MIIKNAIQCNHCKEEIRSYNVHDAKMCHCNTCGVDGGYEYLRRVGDNYTEKSVYFNSETHFADVREYVLRGGRGEDGRQPFKYVPLPEIDDEWLEAIIKYGQIHRPHNRFLILYQLEKMWREEQNV